MHIYDCNCPLAIYFYLFFFFSDKVVKLIGEGSVINGAYPVLLYTFKYLLLAFIVS